MKQRGCLKIRNYILKKIHTIIFPVAIFVFAACKKTGVPAPPQLPSFTTGYNIFMAGSANWNPVYWKNGQPVKLDTMGNAYSIAVSGTDVYASGILDKGNDMIAVYWKNGQKFQLEDSGISHAYGIALQGSDVYCAGDLFGPLGSGIVHAVYWKNGILTTLSPFTNGVARSICIGGPEIYISGQVFANGWDTAVVWKDGVQNYYGEPGCMNAMTFTATDTFVVGNFGSGGAYWTPKEFKQIDGFLSSVAIDGADVYLGGVITNTDGLNQAAYWKNNALNILPNSYRTSTVYGIAVAGDDIYVVGNVQDGSETYPVYWKNGVMYKLGSEGEIRDIKVVQQ